MINPDNISSLSTDKEQPQGALSSPSLSELKFTGGGKGQVASITPTKFLPDEATSKSMLERMQKLVEEKPFENLQTDLQRMYAFTKYDKEPMFRQLAEQQQVKDAQRYNIAQSMAALEAQQAARKDFLKSVGYSTQPGAQAQPGAQPGAQVQPDAQISEYQQIISRLPKNYQPGALLAVQRGDESTFRAIIENAEKNRTAESRNLEQLSGMRQDDPLAEMFKGQVFEKGIAPRSEIDAIGNEFRFSPTMGMRNVAPAPTTGGVNLKQIALNAGIPANAIISDYRDPTKQLSLIDKPDPNKPGSYLTAQNKPVALPGQSAHSIPGAAIDIKPGYNITPVQKQALVQAGAVEVPGDPGHYQLPMSKVNAALFANATAPVTAPVRKSVGQIAAETAGETSRQSELGKQYAATDKQVRDDGRTAGERQVNQDAILKLLDDPDIKNMIGKFRTGTKSDVIIQQLQDGINAGNFGSIGLNKLQENLAQEGQTPTAIRKFDQLKSFVKQNELEWRRQYLKGQGSVSNMEGQTVQEAIGSVNDPVGKLKMIAAVMRERAVFDAEVAQGLKNMGKGANVGDFLDSNDYTALNDKHNNRLATILNKDPSELKSNFGFKITGGSESSAPSAVKPFSDSAKEKRYQDFLKNQPPKGQ